MPPWWSLAVFVAIGEGSTLALLFGLYLWILSSIKRDDRRYGTEVS